MHQQSSEGSFLVRLPFSEQMLHHAGRYDRYSCQVVLSTFAAHFLVRSISSVKAGLFQLKFQINFLSCREEILRQLASAVAYVAEGRFVVALGANASGGLPGFRNGQGRRGGVCRGGKMRLRSANRRIEGSFGPPSCVSSSRRP